MLREASTEDQKMRRKRRNHSASFKAKLAVAAVRGEKTLAELAQHYDVHPNQLQDWRSQLMANAERLFERGAGRDHDTEHQLKELHAKIGQLTMERDFDPARSVVESHAAHDHDRVGPLLGDDPPVRAAGAGAFECVPSAGAGLGA